MSCCRCECLSVVIGIIAGVILGILSFAGFVSTGVIFWVLLAFGLFETLLAPIYGFLNQDACDERCFCSYRRLLTFAAVGAIITSVIGLIIAGLGFPIVLAIVVGLSVFFSVMLLVALICLARCACQR